MADEQEEKYKPADAVAGGDDNSDQKFVQITVSNEQQQEVKFKIKPTTQLRKVLENYRTRIGSTGTLKLRYDGKPVRDDDTPEKLGMEDGDMLEAFEPQVGG